MQRALDRSTPLRAWLRAPVVVELLGGLGNQMFQYATALAVGRRAGLPVRVDTRRLVEDPKRELEIDAFPACRIREAGRWERLPGDLRRPTLARWARVAGAPAPLVERGDGFDPRVVAARSGVYLRGYWQCERYFDDCEALVRATFSTERLPSPRVREGGSRLRDPRAVAVHVRRGDYAHDPVTRSVHGLLPRGYYERAVAHVRARVPDARFHLFSDDPRWVREAFAWLEGAELGSEPAPDPGPAGRAVEDLARMASCRHHVIANSSYSWWAAWLGGGPGQVVVAPRRWFAEPGRDAADRIPHRWHRT